MCKIKFLVTFIMNVGVPDFPKKSYSKKTSFLKNKQFQTTTGDSPCLRFLIDHVIHSFSQTEINQSLLNRALISLKRGSFHLSLS